MSVTTVVLCSLTTGNPKPIAPVCVFVTTVVLCSLTTGNPKPIAPVCVSVTTVGTV